MGSGASVLTRKAKQQRQCKASSGVCVLQGYLYIMYIIQRIRNNVESRGVSFTSHEYALCKQARYEKNQEMFFSA